MRNNTISLALVSMAVVAIGAVGVAQQAATAPALPKVTVYKTSTCGCCKLWIEHMKTNGFTVQAMDTSAGDVRAVSKAAGLKDQDTSCHTAKIGDYTVEGHVPAADIKRLLKEKPAGVVGLSAPGMPQGSPGMEQGSKEPYDVIAFKKDGTSTVFAKHK